MFGSLDLIINNIIIILVQKRSQQPIIVKSTIVNSIGSNVYFIKSDYSENTSSNQFVLSSVWKLWFHSAYGKNFVYIKLR